MSYADEVACINTSFLQLNNNGNMISEWYNAGSKIRMPVFRVQPQEHYSENLMDRDFLNSAPGLYTENSRKCNRTKDSVSQP